MLPAEFIRHFRMDRIHVFRLNALIDKDRAFRKVPGKKQKLPSIYHLLVLLRYLGSEGSGGSCAEASVFFGVGKGKWLIARNGKMKTSTVA